MAATKSMGDGTQMRTLEDLVCSSSLAGELQQYSLLLSAVNIFFSLTAFLGNSLIFVALHKTSSIHPPSKLLYRCLATTDLLVGLVGQPLVATFWMSVVREQWRLCRFAWEAAFVSGYGLSLISLLTMAAMSVDRLLALFFGAEIQTNCNFKAHICHCRYSLDHNRCRYSMPHVSVSYSAVVWSHYNLILPINLDCFLC